jgi:hypothetical protein
LLGFGAPARQVVFSRMFGEPAANPVGLEYTIAAVTCVFS